MKYGYLPPGAALSVLCVLVMSPPARGAATRHHRHHGNQALLVPGMNTDGATTDGQTESQQDKPRELWLEDFSKDYLNEMQSDGVGGASAGRRGQSGGEAGQCPPPFNALPRDACDATPCASDTECGGHRCCFNGCRFTCMTAMPLPPLVDWRIEPPRKQSGRSWLLPASNDSNSDNAKAEYCSTSQIADNEDAVLCPHGYICHIEYLGNAVKGVPNRGRCIPTVHRTSESHKMFQMRSHNSNSSRCVVPGNGIYRNGTRFRFERHMCQCQRGTVTCRVGRG